MRGDRMMQKGNFKDILVMRGMGRVDDTRPIDYRSMRFRKARILKIRLFP